MFSLFLQPPSQLYGSLRQPEAYFASMFSDNAKICNPSKGKKRQRHKKNRKIPNVNPTHSQEAEQISNWQSAISDLIGVWWYLFILFALVRCTGWQCYECWFCANFWILSFFYCSKLDRYGWSVFYVRVSFARVSNHSKQRHHIVHLFFGSFADVQNRHRLWYYCFRVNNIYTVWG